MQIVLYGKFSEGNEQGKEGGGWLCQGIQFRIIRVDLIHKMSMEQRFEEGERQQLPG